MSSVWTQVVGGEDEPTGAPAGAGGQEKVGYNFQVEIRKRR